MAIICPLCSDSIDDMKTHLMRHFKYKKFPCADLDCDEQFYTENERKLHCDKTKHKRCFQETVNVYLDMIVEMVSKDATLVESVDFSTIVELRRAAIAESSADLEKLATKQPINPPISVKRRRTATENKEAEQEGGTSAKSKRRSKTLTATTAAHSEDDTTVTTTSALSESVSRTPARSRKSDAEKKSNNETSPPKTLPVALEQALAMNTSNDGSTNDSTAMGFYDPNDPLRRDWSKVKCNTCNKEVMYDYISRKFHVTKEHINADNEPEDYDVLYKNKMDEAFPDLPNSDNACQLCMTGLDVRVGSRREHIERKHFMALVELSCPVDKCGIRYFRQCDLGAHMRTAHKSDLSKYKNREFQDGRRRRNAMISMMTNKCFPIAQYATFIKHIKPAEKTDPTQALVRAKELSDAANSSAFSKSFVNDVRVRELEKTRRAPIYNQASSSSSDSSDNETEDVTKKDKRKQSISEEEQRLSEDDVIFLSQTFESQVMQKLKQMATVKSEASRYPEDLVVEEQQPVMENTVVEENDEKEDKQLCLIQPPEWEENDKNSPQAAPFLLTNIQEKEEVKEPTESVEQEKNHEEIESRNYQKEREDVHRIREPQRFREPSTYSERREYSSYNSSRDRYTPYRSRDSYLPHSSSSSSFSSRDRGSSSYYSSNPSSSSSYYNRSQSVPRSDRNYRSKHYTSSYSSNRDY